MLDTVFLYYTTYFLWNVERFPLFDNPDHIVGESWEEPLRQCTLSCKFSFLHLLRVFVDKYSVALRATA